MLALLLLVALPSLTLEVNVPATTPAGDPVHVAGNFQGWDPGSPAHQLQPAGGQLHRLTLELAAGQALEFKFTRGSWATVEKGAAGEELPNRQHTVGAYADTLRFTVARWADQSSTPSTITGDVSTTTVPGFLDGRRVWVYRPPGYDSQPERSYPVLYLLDGQNIFDAATSFAGEWRVDESCEQLVRNGDVEPLIVVAVDNGGAARIDEYTPWPDPSHGGGGGAAHLQAIATVLKPWVDANFRTKAGPVDTGFGGSSLGGLMALWAATEHGGSFGRIAALSPSLWWDDEHMVAHVQQAPRAARRVWADMGTAEGGVEALHRLRDALVADGFTPGDDLQVVEVAGGEHNEAAWAQRFPDVLRFLFPAGGQVGTQRMGVGGFKAGWR